MCFLPDHSQESIKEETKHKVFHTGQSLLKTEVGYTLLDFQSNVAYSIIMLKIDILAGFLGCVALHQQNTFPVERLHSCTK